MSRIYYRGARAAILCFDLTDAESFDKARYWAGELEQNEPVKLFVQIVYNKLQTIFRFIRWRMSTESNY